MKTLIGLGTGIGVLLVIMMTLFGVFNTENRLRQRYFAQAKVVQLSHDKMWKTISEQYNISSEYGDKMIEVIKAAAEGRQGGSLFKSIHEAVPGLDSSIYANLMASIDGNRSELMRNQSTWVDVWREHNTYINSMPQFIFVGGRSLEEPKIITSERTQEAARTGRDNEIIGKKK